MVRLSIERSLSLVLSAIGFGASRPLALLQNGSGSFTKLVKLPMLLAPEPHKWAIGHEAG
jgi:hypothetical protein